MTTALIKSKYGLIDSFYRHIWIIVPDEENAHYIRKTFWSKTQMLVFDLTQFENYNAESISNNHKFDWAIEHTNYDSPLIYPAARNQAFNITHTTYTSNMLINESTYSPFPDELRYDLKNQMLFFNNCIELIQIKCGRFSENNNNTDLEVFLNSFVKIFQLELTLAEIQEQVYQLAITNLKINFFPPFILLNILKRQYE